MKGKAAVEKSRSRNQLCSQRPRKCGPATASPTYSSRTPPVTPTPGRVGRCEQRICNRSRRHRFAERERDVKSAANRHMGEVAGSSLTAPRSASGRKANQCARTPRGTRFSPHVRNQAHFRHVAGPRMFNFAVNSDILQGARRILNGLAFRPKSWRVGIGAAGKES